MRVELLLVLLLEAEEDLHGDRTESDVTGLPTGDFVSEGKAGARAGRRRRQTHLRNDGLRRHLEDVGRHFLVADVVLGDTLRVRAWQTASARSRVSVDAGGV